MTLQEFEAMLREIFPIKAAPASLDLLGLVQQGVHIKIQLRLVLYEGDSVRSFIEQEVLMGDEGILLWGQAEMYFRAYAEAAGQALAEPREHLMPRDLFPRVFMLKRATTQEDYQRALLTKNRLWKVL
jgi:hypothetical protein